MDLRVVWVRHSVRAVLAGALLLALLPASSSQASHACSGVRVVPGSGLSVKAASAPAGSTFCIEPGIHQVPSSGVLVQSGDRFIGAGSSAVFVRTTSAEQVFVASGSTGALIQGMAVSGAIGGDYCEPNCGRGVALGTNTTMRGLRLHDNANQGAGGKASGLLLDNVELDHNGSTSFLGCCAAGIKMVGSGNVIRNSYAHDNIGNGFWCDVFCNNFTVEGSRSIDNTRKGIFFELSIGAVIRNNTISSNGSGPYDAGLAIFEANNVDAYGNTISNQAHNVMVVEEPARPIVVGNVKIHDNRIMGSGTTGEKRTTAVAWTNNDYCQPTATGKFFESGGTTLTWAEWQAIGHDTSGASTNC